MRQGEETSVDLTDAPIEVVTAARHHAAGVIFAASALDVAATKLLEVATGMTHPLTGPLLHVLPFNGKLDTLKSIFDEVGRAGTDAYFAKLKDRATVAMRRRGVVAHGVFTLVGDRWALVTRSLAKDLKASDKDCVFLHDLPALEAELLEVRDRFAAMTESGGGAKRTPEEQDAFAEAVELKAREIAAGVDSAEALAITSDLLEAAARRARTMTIDEA